jgi:mRNA-degrading endonuclease RelE of RelBE toxin-antitoxin system
MEKNRVMQLEDFRREFDERKKAFETRFGQQQKAIGAGAATSQEVAKKEEPGQLATHTSYTREERRSETKSLQIGKYRLLYKFIDQTKEKDGVVLPHIVRQIDCNPAAPLNLLLENAIFEEELEDGKKMKILSQFEQDTKNVQDLQKPNRIVKYVNSIIQEDPNDAGSKIYGVKVVYLNKNNDRYRYYYRKRAGDAQPQMSIDRSTKLFSSFFF